jgi:translation initiation factor 5B
MFEKMPVSRRYDILNEMKNEVQSEFDKVFSKISKSQRGVWVQASTLGSLEALLSWLQGLSPPIPVCGMGIGDIHKRDVIQASVMLEHQPEFACILAFNVRIQEDARTLATEMGVRLFEAEIIYHLEKMFKDYVEEIYETRRAGAKDKAVFPVEMEILPEHVIHNKYPIILGCLVRRGILRIGTPICVKRFDPVSKLANPLYIGNVTSIQYEKKDRQKAKVGEKIAVKFEGDDSLRSIQFGRQFTHEDRLVSRISRESIDAIKAHFIDQLADDDKYHLRDLKEYFSVV